jgi:hypothetical protein
MLDLEVGDRSGRELWESRKLCFTLHFASWGKAFCVSQKKRANLEEGVAAQEFVPFRGSLQPACFARTGSDLEGLGVESEEGNSALESLALRKVRVSLLSLHFAPQQGEFEGALIRKERVQKGGEGYQALGEVKHKFASVPAHFSFGQIEIVSSTV